MLDAQRIGVAGHLETGFRTVRLHVRAQVVEDRGQIGKHAHDGRPAEASRQITILAVRRATLGQMELPVRRRRDRLQPERPRRCGNDRQGRFAEAVGFALVRAAHAGEPVGGQFLHGQVQRFHAVADRTAMGFGQGGRGKYNPARHPAAGGTTLPCHHRYCALCLGEFVKEISRHVYICRYA